MAFFLPLLLFSLFRNISCSSGTLEAKKNLMENLPRAESIWHALSYCYSNHRATALVLPLPAQYNPPLLHLTLSCTRESNSAACRTEVALGIINLPLLTPAGRQTAVGARSLSCRQSPTEKIAKEENRSHLLQKRDWGKQRVSIVMQFSSLKMCYSWIRMKNNLLKCCSTLFTDSLLHHSEPLIN